MKVTTTDKATGDAIRKAKVDQAKREAERSASSSRQQATVNEQVSQAKTEAKQAASQPSQQDSNQRKVQCPFCADHVKKKDVSGGSKEIGLFQLRIPLPPFITKMLSPDPQKCSCGGKRTIPDVSDDSARYQQVAQVAEANIDKTLDLEAKLGTGGSRTTIIQASETLYVGLGFNKNESYKTIPKGQKSPGSIVPDPKTGAAFAKGYDSNAVQGVQTSIGWPTANGTYSIKCANKYQLLTGAGGITMATKGPLTVNAGIISITGPQVTIGSSTGPLTLEGDVVSITGKTISLTPTDANVFVKGTISSTGNAVFGGQVHAETLSFCKASCPATETTTTLRKANPGSSQTFPASWGGAGIKGITSSVLDIQIYLSDINADFETSLIKVLSPEEKINLSNKFSTLAKMLLPFELLPTGIALMPSPLGPPIPIPVYNFPHTHGLPDMTHVHKVKVPDIDYENYSSPQAVRAKVMSDALTSNATFVPSNTVQDTLNFAYRLPSFLNNLSYELVLLKQKALQLFS